MNILEFWEHCPHDDPQAQVVGFETYRPKWGRDTLSLMLQEAKHIHSDMCDLMTQKLELRRELKNATIASGEDDK